MNCKKFNQVLFNRAFFRVPGMDAMIYCKDGQCKFVNPTELLLNQSEEEILASNQVTINNLKPLVLSKITLKKNLALISAYLLQNKTVQ